MNNQVKIKPLNIDVTWENIDLSKTQVNADEQIRYMSRKLISTYSDEYKIVFRVFSVVELWNSLIFYEVVKSQISCLIDVRKSKKTSILLSNDSNPIFLANRASIKSQLFFDFNTEIGHIQAVFKSASIKRGDNFDLILKKLDFQY